MSQLYGRKLESAMAQSKRQKQERALNRLISELQAEKESRASLQNQTYGLIEPSENEMRISREVFNLNSAMGLSQEESPF